MSFSTIDLIRDGNLGRSIDQAFSNIGFAILQNIGIRQQLLDDVFRASETFFLKSSKQTFENCRYRSSEENFGYQGLMEENLDPSSPADVKATFTMRNILNQPPEDDRWPSGQFRELMSEFYRQALGAAHDLQKIMAEHFDLTPEFFRKLHTGENVTLRLLYYPPIINDKLSQGQLGAGAHSDYGFMTLLFQRGQSGLEVLSKDGTWLSVPPDADKVVVNSGDLLEHWTNGKYKSTLHRVQPQIGNTPRFSIAFFVDTDSDAMISPLPSLVSLGGSEKTAPIKAGDFIQSRINASHKGRFGQPSTESS